MAKNIKNIVDRVRFLVGKYDTGYFPPETIVEEVNQQSYDLFKELIAEYAATRQISEFLQPFMATFSLTFSSGAASKPSGFQHHIDIYTDSATVEVLEDHAFQTRKNHVNKPPSVEYPIAKYTATQIKILPNTITSGTLEYFRLPVAAVYAYTGSGDDLVYDDTNSIALEWSGQMINKITLNTLSKLGVSVDDREVTQYGLINEQK